jgi:hypothetical protein
MTHLPATSLKYLQVVWQRFAGQSLEGIAVFDDLPTLSLGAFVSPNITTQLEQQSLESTAAGCHVDPWSIQAVLIR